MEREIQVLPKIPALTEWLLSLMPRHGLMAYRFLSINMTRLIRPRHFQGLNSQLTRLLSMKMVM